MATQNRMSDTRGGGNSRRQFLSDADITAGTGVLMKSSDQMEYDVGYAFAAKCFPEGSAVDGVESRLNVQECNVQWSVKFTM